MNFHEGTMINPASSTGTPSSEVDAKQLAKILTQYQQASNGRAILEILITLIPFFAIWILMWASLEISYLLTLLLAIPATGFLLRIFLVQHDCGHGSFFTSKQANDWVGRIFGVLTLTPYAFWQRTHALHHASSGSLEHRGFGDVDTLTTAEYNARSFWGKLRYRIYRHPIVMFGIGPAYLFILQHRLPVGLMRRGWQPWLSTMGTNLSLALLVGGVIWLVGLKAFLMVQLPFTILGATAGVWMFYVQHQFEHTLWEEKEDWSRLDSALHGSSHYDLPGILRWFTANIGIHHVHHLCSRIPYYRLNQVLIDHPQLRDVSRLTLLESFACVRLVLWDKAANRLISFREAASQRVIIRL